VADVLRYLLGLPAKVNQECCEGVP
jgi:hypothetical protein